MHLHFLTLKRQANFLKERIYRSIIRDSFSQVKNEWVLHLGLPDGGEKYLQLSCHPRYPFAVLSYSIKRQKNSTTVMEESLNQKTTNLQIIPGERIIRMDFENTNLKLMINLFTTNSNFFIVNDDNLIINSFKKSKTLIETTYSIPDSTQTDISAITSSQLLKMIRSNSEKSLLPFLKKNFFHLNQTVLNEIFFRLEIPRNTSSEKLQDEHIIKLYDE